VKVGLINIKIPNVDRALTAAPNGIAYLASYIKQYNGIEDVYIEVYPEKLMQRRPDVVGISTISQTFNKVKQLAKSIKEFNPKIKVIVGGPHITSLTETMTKYMDVAVLGEGEIQFGEVIKLIQDDNFNSEELKKIKGLAFWDENNELFNTGERPWNTQLDLIPPPDRKLISSIYLKEGEVPFQHQIMTERGCPFKCLYCSATAFWDKLRQHSIERVHSEILYLVNNFPEQKMIGIVDDLFGNNKKRLRQIVDMIRSEGLHKKFGFVCQTRASVFDEERAEMFAEMNMRIACFGFESSNDRVLKYLKGSGKAKDNQRAVDICDKHGINTLGNFILGSPTETEEEASDTYWFIRRNFDKLWRTGSGTATPYPGTKWWDYALEHNLVDSNFDRWEVLDLTFDKYRTVYMSDTMDKETFTHILKEFQYLSNKKAISAPDDFEVKENYREFLESQYYLVSRLMNIEGKNILEITSKNLSVKEFINRASVKNIKIFNGNVKFDSLENKEKFDFIFIPYGLETMINPKEFLEQIKEYISENGQILLLNYNIAHFSSINNILDINWQNQVEGLFDKKNISFFSCKTLEKILKDLNFKKIKIDKANQPLKQYTKVYESILEISSKILDIKEHISDRDCRYFLTSCSLSD
jgi:anaerobic magnesium-protoporphyrin IX monomethyl ester cyclase